jgi:hypothetical protein
MNKNGWEGFLGVVGPSLKSSCLKNEVESVRSNFGLVGRFPVLTFPDPEEKVLS